MTASKLAPSKGSGSQKSPCDDGDRALAFVAECNHGRRQVHPSDLVTRVEQRRKLAPGAHPEIEDAPGAPRSSTRRARRGLRVLAREGVVAIVAARDGVEEAPPSRPAPGSASLAERQEDALVEARHAHRGADHDVRAIRAVPGRRPLRSKRRGDGPARATRRGSERRRAARATRGSRGSACPPAARGGARASGGREARGSEERRRTSPGTRGGPPPRARRRSSSAGGGGARRPARPAPSCRRSSARSGRPCRASGSRRAACRGSPCRRRETRCRRGSARRPSDPARARAGTSRTPPGPRAPRPPAARGTEARGESDAHPSSRASDRRAGASSFASPPGGGAP